MSERENAVIDEDQNNWTHFMIDLIIFYFESLDFESDNDVKETESKQLIEKVW